MPGLLFLPHVARVEASKFKDGGGVLCGRNCEAGGAADGGGDGSHRARTFAQGRGNVSISQEHGILDGSALGWRGGADGYSQTRHKTGDLL